MVATKAEEGVQEESSGEQQNAGRGSGHTSETRGHPLEKQRLLPGTEESPLPGDTEATRVCSSFEEEDTCLNGWPGFSLIGRVCESCLQY